MIVKVTDMMALKLMGPTHKTRAWYLSGKFSFCTITAGTGGNLVPALKKKKELICHVEPFEKWQGRSCSPFSLHIPQKGTVERQFGVQGTVSIVPVQGHEPGSVPSNYRHLKGGTEMNSTI